MWPILRTWAFRHWLAIVGGVGSLWPIIHALIKVGGDIDFVAGLVGEPGWVRTVIQFILDPPGWALVVAIFAGGGLIAWDARRNRETALGGDKAAVTGTVSNTEPLPFGRGLYVGYVYVSTDKLESELWIEISARCFNRTGHSVSVHKIQGTITAQLSKDGSSPDFATLPQPHLMESAQHDRVPDATEFSVRLEQRVSRDVAVKILAVSETESVHLDLSGLSVIIAAKDQAELTARLPIWDGIRLSRRPDAILPNQIVSARTTDTIHLKTEERLA